MMDGWALGIFDTALAAFLVLLASGALLSSSLFRSVVLFVSFGLVTSLAWARLGAPDIALAEAAIGAGLTGVIFLNAVSLAERRKAPGGEPRLRISPGARFLVISASVPAAAAVLAVLIFSTAFSPPSPGLSAEVDAMLGKSGVTHPVTAVLLNFRGYDTLLEVSVLVAALAASMSLGPGPSAFTYLPPAPVASAVARASTPIFITVSGYLLYIGSSEPGGAFQAGAVLGVGGVLLLLSGLPYPAAGGGFPRRALLAGGLAVFVVAAVAGMATGGDLLEYPGGWEYRLIFIIEAALTVSIAFILVELFVVNIPGIRGGGRSAAGRGENR